MQLSVKSPKHIKGWAQCFFLNSSKTALRLWKLATNINALPACIKPSELNLAWDNIDRLEETLTGKGTYASTGQGLWTRSFAELNSHVLKRRTEISQC